MKYALIVCILCFSFIKIFGQNDTLNSVPINPEWNTGFRFSMQLGTYLPLGKLAKTLRPSPSLGMFVGAAVSKKIKVELGGTFFIPINSNRFNYRLPDTVLLAKPSQVGFGASFFVSRVYELKPKFFIDGIVGLGFNEITTDKEKEKPEDENDKNYSLKSGNLSLGFNLRKEINKKRSVGLNLMYNLTPYSVFQKFVDSDFGSNSLVVGIFYKL